MIWTESTFDPFAQSPTGPVGLMQISGWATRDLDRLSRRTGRTFMRDDVLVDPLLNVAAGSLYLRQVYDLYAGQVLSDAIQRYSTEPGYPVQKILECEKCLKDVPQDCKQDPQKCLNRIHK
jgi:soluble lytic murein transglycosylase-like protein